MFKKCCYDSSDSWNSVIVSLNSHLKQKFISTIVNAVDLVIFANEAKSAISKEIVGLFLSAYDHE